MRFVSALYRGIDPFAFFQADESVVDMQGWNSEHAFLRESVQAIKPSVIIEVGVWKGGSVITFADEANRLSLDSVVIAVDTWRGSCEHWLDDQWFKSLRISGGLTRLQETFMANVVAMSLQHLVLPLPLDSVNAYEIMRFLGVRADIVHIDAGHDYESVATDLRLWSSLLRKDGLMIMDDYSKDESGQPQGWVEVARAVDDFVAGRNDCIANFRHCDNKCMFSVV
jgi:hypothetical protein